MILDYSAKFKKDLKNLKKKYPLINRDVNDIITLLQQNQNLGIPLGNNCYKIRLANSSVPTGKSGGFRIITLFKIENDKIILLTIYSKSEKDNILDNELSEIIESLN